MYADRGIQLLTADGLLEVKDKSLQWEHVACKAPDWFEASLHEDADKGLRKDRHCKASASASAEWGECSEEAQNMGSRD